jgi:hypothetical protein
MKTKMILTSFVAALALGLLVTTPIKANTPDGIAPAEETTCDGLRAEGVTKGLYGLCLAYCEATDSPEDIIDAEVNGEEFPIFSAKLLDNYNKKRAKSGNVDPEMPCATYYDETACPAWTSEMLSHVGTLIPNQSEPLNQQRYDDRYGYQVRQTMSVETTQDGEYGRYKYDADKVGDCKYEVGTMGECKYNRWSNAWVQAVADNNTGEYSYSASIIVRTTNIVDRRRKLVGFYVRNYTPVLNEEQHSACESEILAHIMPRQAP